MQNNNNEHLEVQQMTQPPKSKNVLGNSNKYSGSASAYESKPTIMPTGISLLDDSLSGGLPSSSLVYFSADPLSMSEVFLYQFSQTRKTYYFATGRRPKYIHQDIVNLGFDPSNIIFVDVYGEYYFTQTGEMVSSVGNEFVDSKIIEFTEYNLQNIALDAEGDEVNVIFDTFSFYTNLNVNTGLIKRLLNMLYETTKQMVSQTYLYSLKRSSPEALESDLLNSADVIFDVLIERSSDQIINKLSIPKIRGMVPTSDVIKFNVANGVHIDTSKDVV